MADIVEEPNRGVLFVGGGRGLSCMAHAPPFEITANPAAGQPSSCITVEPEFHKLTESYMYIDRTVMRTTTSTQQYAICYT